MITLSGLLSMAAQETGEVWLALVTIKHPDLATPARIVRNTENITSRGDEYIAIAFDVALPSSDGEAQETSASLVLDAVDQSLLPLVNALESPPTIDIELVLASDPDTVQKDALDLRLTDLVATVQTLEAKLAPPTHMNEVVPGYTMNRVNTPGLHSR